MEEIEDAIKHFNEMTKSEIIIEIQKLGFEPNPNMKKEELVNVLKEKALQGAQTNQNTTQHSAQYQGVQEPVKDKTFEEKMLSMMGEVVAEVNTLKKDVQRIKDGGANDFKAAAVPEDVAQAEAMNSKLDPRVAKIIENTLGVDFSADVTTFQDKPGFLLNIHVPKRLSPITDSFRPVIDKESGAYKIDPDTKRVMEEKYWPGDTRSVALGSTDSFDVVQQHCNRVRSFILATYQKNNRPQPEFRTK